MTELHPSGDRIMWTVKEHGGPVTLEITVHRETVAAIRVTKNPDIKGSWKNSFFASSSVKGSIKCDLVKELNLFKDSKNTLYQLGIKAEAILSDKVFVRMAIRQNESVVPATTHGLTQQESALNKLNGKDGPEYGALEVLVATRTSSKSIQPPIHYFALRVQ